jgi:hypothetical protein
MGSVAMRSALAERTCGPSTRVCARARHVVALLSALTLSSLATLMPTATPAQAAEGGVNILTPTPSQVATESTLGTHWVRVFATWPDLEPARGSYAQNWFQMYENLFATLPRGTKVIIDMVETPSWETGSPDPHTPPANLSDYAAFLAAVAQRFAGRVAAYEIWNEEDASRWWAGGPNAGAYAALLRAAYPAIKRVDPQATVVLGGMTGNDYPFLEEVYAAGGKGYFDAVGVHTDTACNILSPYEFLRGAGNRMIVDSFLAYREVHQVMVANGDEKPIWMTETSWRTTSATCSEGAWAGQKREGVSLEQQAGFLAQEYHCMKEDPYLQVALWFPLQDEGRITSGLERTNGSHKPSFDAMRSYAQSGDGLTESCGVLTGPRIRVHTPANNVRYTGPLPIHVDASSSIGVFRITLKVDGRLIRNFGTHSYPSTLVGSMLWFGAHHIPYGRHRLTIIAYDKQRNVSEMSVTIIRVRPHRNARPRHHRKH